MENASTLNVKKIAFIVTGILLVVALGIYLGKGDLLKGSFVDPTKESDSVPSPTDVKLTKDASGKYVLSWKYTQADLTQTNLKAFVGDDSVPVASFEWEIETPSTIVWGNGPNANNFYNPAEVDAPEAHCYTQVVKISDGKDYGSAFTCTSVYLDQKAVDALLDGESPLTLRVWADLGTTDGIPQQVDDGFGGTITTEKSLISKPGTGTYTLPVIPAPKAVDTVGFGGSLEDPQNPPPDWLPTLIGWGWSDGKYVANDTNSLFKDKDGYYFGYDWEVLDVSDAAKPVSVFKKDIYGSPGTVQVEAGNDAAAATKKAIDSATKSFLVNDPTKKVWVLPYTYVPQEVKFEEGHSYIARVKVYNGVVAADKTTLVASAAKDSAVYMRPISSVAVAPKSVDLKMNGDVPYRFTATWSDSHYGPTTFNTKYTSGGKPVFAYEWSLIDVSDSNKVVLEKKITTDPGTEFVKTSGKGNEDQQLKTACYVDMLDAAGKTVKAWICPTGYIDSTFAYVPGKTYEIRVKVDNGIGLTASVATTQFMIPPKVTPAPVPNSGLQPLPKLDNLDITVPEKAGDLVAISYGWKDPTIKPSATTTSLKDSNGTYYFVYGVIVRDSTGKPIWGIGYKTHPESIAVNKSNPCLITTPDSISMLVCQKVSIPSDITLTPGQYTVSVNTVAYTATNDPAPGIEVQKNFNIPDLAPPELVSATAISKNQVKVVFSEAVKKLSGFNYPFTFDGPFYIYIVQPNGTIVPGKVTDWKYDPADVDANGVGKTIILTTEDQKAGQKYQVSASALAADLAGNPPKNPSAVVEFYGYGSVTTFAQSPDYTYWSGSDFQTGAPKSFGWYWKDSMYGASAETTLYTADSLPVFVYQWEIEDTTDKKIIFTNASHNDVWTPPKQYEYLKDLCFTKLDNDNVIGSKVWTCNNAYIPTELASSFILGHSYVFRVTVDNGFATNAVTTSKPFTVEAPKFPDAPTEEPRPLDYVNVTLPQKVGDLVKFDVGWNDKTIAPTKKNSYYKDAAGNSKFVYSWNITENTKDGDVVAYQPYWKPLPEYASCALSPTDNSWVCPYGYIPYDVNLEMGKTYVLNVSMENGWNYYEQFSSKPFTMVALAPAVPVKPLDFVTINFSEGASGDNPVRFEYGWNVTVVPSVTNTSLKNAKGEPVFSYGWYLYDAADVNGAPVWKKEKGEKFEDLSVLPPGCTSADSAECAPELVKIYAALYKSCFEKIDSTSFAWTCAKGYIPPSVVLDPKKQYVMKVLVYNGKDVTEKTASKAFTVAGPAVPPVVPPTMTLKNLSVKKLSDGNIAVTYTVDLAGKWTAEEFSSEVRLNGAKTFVARFTEKVKAGVSSYTYEAVLLPWEIKSGDTVSVVMGANGLGAGSYLNDGQSVKYEAGGTVATAVVGLVTANALPAATVGSPYSAAIVVKDGVAPYKYVVMVGSTLPGGLSLDSLTGVLSGTPTSQGDYAFGLSITDSKNAALNATFTLKIVPAPVGGAATVSGGGTTIINNYTTYNPAAPTGGSGSTVVVTPPLKPVAPVIDSTKFTFPVNLADVSRFRDTTYHWAKNYINVLWNAGYVQGYTVVEFGPDDSLTRAQLLKIVMESLRYKLPEKVAFSPCTDVRPDHWHAKYFAVAREKGIIGGYTDGTCKPNKATNRAEALKILYGAIGKMPQIPAVVITPTVPAGFRNIFVDVDEKSWYYPYFANAVSMGWLKGYEDSTIRPDDELSRAQMAKIVVLAMQKLSWVR